MKYKRSQLCMTLLWIGRAVNKYRSTLWHLETNCSENSSTHQCFSLKKIAVYCVLYNYTISEATYSCTITNVKNSLTWLNIPEGSRVFPELLLFKDGVISDFKKGGKKHFNVYLFWALVEIDVAVQHNNSWSLLRYLFCRLSWLNPFTRYFWLLH